MKPFKMKVGEKIQTSQGPKTVLPVEKKKPTAEGYWWTRPDSGCMWRVVEISIHGGRTYIEEMGEEGQGHLPACPWWEWVGPIAPPQNRTEHVHDEA